MDLNLTEAPYRDFFQNPARPFLGTIANNPQSKIPPAVALQEMLYFSQKAHFWNLQVLEVSFHMQHVAKKLFPAELQPSKEFFIRNFGEPLLIFSKEIFGGHLRI